MNEDYSSHPWPQLTFKAANAATHITLTYSGVEWPELGTASGNIIRFNCIATVFEDNGTGADWTYRGEAATGYTVAELDEFRARLHDLRYAKSNLARLPSQVGGDQVVCRLINSVKGTILVEATIETCPGWQKQSARRTRGKEWFWDRNISVASLHIAFLTDQSYLIETETQLDTIKLYVDKSSRRKNL